MSARFLAVLSLCLITLLPLRVLAAIKPSPRPVVIISEIAWEKDHLAIRSDAPLNPKVLTLTKPDRVVVDLVDAELADPSLSQALKVHRGFISQIRIAQHPSGYLRVVFDCSRPTILQVLQPKEKNKFSLLIQESEELPLFTEASPMPAPTPSPKRTQFFDFPRPLVFGPQKVFYGPSLLPLAKVFSGPSPLPRVKVFSSPSPRPRAKVFTTFSPPSLLPVILPAVSSASLAISLNYRLGATRLSIKTRGKTLPYQLSHGYAPPRLSIRVPRSSFEGPLPVPCGAIINLAYRQEGENILLEVGLPEGPFQVEEQKKNDTVTFLWKPQPRPKILPLVVIDPGHGGTDPGAVGPTGLRESQVNLELALKLKEELKKLNVDSVLTRETDVFVDLAPRPTFAEGMNARMLVSLHCNSYPGSEATGAESYYRQDGSIPLAKTLHNALIEDLGRPDRGVRQARLYVLRSSLIPSALLETAFISNPNEEAILKDQEFQGQAAKAIAGGIWQYLFAPATPELTP